MPPIQIQRLAAVTYRKRLNTHNLKRNLKLAWKNCHPHVQLFSVAPQMICSALTMMATYDNRRIQEPLIRLTTLLSKTIQNGILTALYNYLSKTTQVGIVDEETIRKPTSRKRKNRVEARRNWEEALRLEKELDLEGAIACLENAVSLHPDNIQYQGLLSKQYTDMSFAPDISQDMAREYNEKALSIAERLVESNPRDPVGHIARGVSKGRLAYYSSNREKIELAREAEDSVKDALKLDDSSDIGHHLMGRFHYEMAGLNVFCRAFVRVVYGRSIRPGSYEEALKEFEKANKLKPDRMIHKIQLGKTYVKLGHKEQALESLQEALDLAVTDINDHLEHLEGMELLRKLTKEK